VRVAGVWPAFVRESRKNRDRHLFFCTTGFETCGIHEKQVPVPIFFLAFGAFFFSKAAKDRSAGPGGPALHHEGRRK